jgi:hypothetical protein
MGLLWVLVVVLAVELLVVVFAALWALFVVGLSGFEAVIREGRCR